MKKSWYVILATMFITNVSLALTGAKVTQVSWTSQGSNSKLDLVYQGVMTETPDWLITGSTFKLFLPKASVEKIIDKTLTGMVHLKTENTKEGATITGTFPSQVKLNSSNTSLNVGDGKIQVIAPTISAAATIPTPTASVVAPTVTETKVLKDSLDEEYLSKLEKEVTAKASEITIVEDKKIEEKSTVSTPTVDTVKISQSSVAKKESNFSLVTYAGKFIAFLGVVLLLFWGLVQLMKKGFLGKGKLSFLNGQQLVSVLSTTYISPKRSLLLVKVSNQVFLIAQSESGMQMISEVNDVPGVVKETEKILTGINFDTNLEDSEQNKPTTEFKIKENIFESKELPTSAIQDVARFSKELKKKVKNLKPLQ